MAKESAVCQARGETARSAIRDQAGKQAKNVLQ